MKKKRGEDYEKRLGEGRGRMQERKIGMNLRQCNLDSGASQHNCIEVRDS